MSDDFLQLTITLKPSNSGTMVAVSTKRRGHVDVPAALALAATALLQEVASLGHPDFAEAVQVALRALEPVGQPVNSTSAPDALQ